MKIGYQGVSGAYSEMAADIYVVDNKIKNAKIIGYTDFDSIFSDVENRNLDLGVVPVENSLAGSIHKNFDLLGKHNLKVVGEVYVHVNHQLLVIPGTKISEVKEIYSHYQALAQCEHNIKEFLPQAKAVEYFDTAGSAEFVSKQGDKSKASLASVKAGKIHNLKVLKKDFQDDKNNYTRFLVIAREYVKFSPTTPNPSSGRRGTRALVTPTFQGGVRGGYKTSIIFAGGNVTGFLFKALACFSLRDINLSKIESRPVPKSPWDYYFYLDFNGKYDDEKVKNAIKNLEEIASYVKVLGSYKAGKV
jgi:prephenate dehydratase